jgi:glycosyltransferase involved in cell wall biosynthesis
MKIAYLMWNPISGQANGIRQQALIWRDALVERGHIVDLIDTWGNYDWKSYDVIHLFGHGNWLSVIDALSQRNPNIVLSPIIDSNQSLYKYRLASYCGCGKLRLFTENYTLRYYSKYVKRFLVRSKHEEQYVLSSTYSHKGEIDLVPLSYRTKAHENIEEVIAAKEPFCFHVSLFTQERKNVMRLMYAATKYNFKLVIAGSKGDLKSYAPFQEFASRHDNITILGYLSEEELESYYNRAKVFALPSLNEGVGLVALEAAMHGCDIVITNIGGPKEYYNGHAYLINPYDVDDIGRKILYALSETKQPFLYNYIKCNYCLDASIEALLTAYI